MFGHHTESAFGTGAGGALQPTPRYNSSILEDMFLEDNAGFIRKTFLGRKELSEALMLLKVCSYCWRISIPK